MLIDMYLRDLMTYSVRRGPWPQETGYLGG